MRVDPNKDALVSSALDAAFATFIAMLDGAGPEGANNYRKLYLSEAHVGNPGIGCPVAALGQDIARSSEDLKATFGRNVDQLAEALAETMQGPAEERKAVAIQQLCMLVGAVVVARATDPQTAGEVLSAVAAAEVLHQQ